MARAFGLAGSFSSGIIEYLGEGAWTKRLHPGLAAQSGYKAAKLAAQGFVAPRFIFEGRHGLFKAFAGLDSIDGSCLLSEIGSKWYLEDIAFKPYSCGTMIHPYIDCMIKLSQMGVKDADIVSIVSETGAGFVPRLWEPLAEKQLPKTPYAAKFSVPWCMAMSFFTHSATLGDFSEANVADSRIAALSQKISYVIDPHSQYPENYAGHILVTLKNGTTKELRQPHLRGGFREPLSRSELIAKFHSNIAYGGWPEVLGKNLLEFAQGLLKIKDLGRLKAFRV
jgi:2-methylcitrate dehydratase PrpD